MQPVFNDLFSRCAQPFAMRVCIEANLARVNASVVQLGGMSDQPALNLVCVGFKVKLQTESVIALREGLVGAPFACRKLRCLERNVELVAMSMQHGNVI